MDRVFLDKIEHELVKIGDTDFWKLYQKRLYEMRQQASRRCETDEIVIRHQERVKAIDEIMELPKKMVEEIKSK